MRHCMNRAGGMAPNIGSLASKSCRSHVSLYQTALITLLLSSTAIAGFGHPRAAAVYEFSFEQQKDKGEQGSEDKTRSFIDESLEDLIKRVRELKTLQAATDQQQLPMILEKTGANVHELFDQLTGLVAKEKVTEENLDSLTGMPLKVTAERFNPLTGMPLSQADQYQVQQDEYNYFIVRKGNLLQSTIEEYRRDADGLEGASGVLLLSSGFASTVLHFSTFLQSESKFRYLGEEYIGSRSAYVIAFAQIPEVATITFKMKQPEGQELQWLIQGIAWVDASSFQILQMRTDLLVPKSLRTKCVTKDQLQTLVKFNEMRLNGLANPVWLPTEAHVHEVLHTYPMQSGLDCKVQGGGEFRNVHHFTDYRTYSVADGISTALKESAPNEPSLEESVQKNDAQAHPYLEEPLKQLVKHIPELKGVRSATSLQTLPMILEGTGKKVDEFFDNLVDLIAQEEIKQERWSGSELVRDNYLILRHGSRSHANIEEFRMDEKGNRMDQAGLDKGFFVTSGFAMSCVHFSRAFQWDSRFLYLGDQETDGRDTYVVAFAQLPSQARLVVTLCGRRGTTVHMLVQGIAWVDKASFQILRMRTDLLASQPEVGLDEETTKVKFSEVHLLDGGVPLWLPREVSVHLKLANFLDRTSDETFQNRHRYKNYRRYRVSARIVAPQ
jgi:hypothetical protein